MKINNPENTGNIIPKAFSIFPLFVSLVVLNGDHVIFKLLSLLFFSLAIYTFFFTRYARYLDTDKKCTIKRLKWLFIKTEEIEPISHFESITISLGGTKKSKWHGFTSTMTFDVVLVRQYACSKTHTGLGGLENFLLKSLITDIEEAASFAVGIGEAVGLPVDADKDLIKFLKYDPLKSIAF